MMIISALVILLSTGTPLIYRQERVGYRGQTFTVLKFRSMAKNAESDGSACWAAINDARVTRFGRFIRRTRIDELPQLAVVGSQLRGGIEIRDAKELRVKESDRISATAENLRAMGAEVEEFEDGLRVAGSTKLRGAKINPRGDHRIAMAFTVAALLAEGETEIEQSDCVAVSFPEFFGLLESVVER